MVISGNTFSESCCSGRWKRAWRAWSAATRGAAGRCSRLSWCSVLQCSSCVTTLPAGSAQRLSSLAGHEPVPREVERGWAGNARSARSPASAKWAILLSGDISPFLEVNGAKCHRALRRGDLTQLGTVTATWPLASQALNKNLYYCGKINTLNCVTDTGLVPAWLAQHVHAQLPLPENLLGSRSCKCHRGETGHLFKDNIKKIIK